MRATLAILVKELRLYYLTPLAWVLYALLAFAGSWIFLWRVDAFHAAAVSYTNAGTPELLEHLNLTDVVLVPLVSFLGTLLLFLAPFLTMRLLAEERARGTLELLVTAPVRSLSVVAGKYLASALVLAGALGLTLVYPVLLEVYGAGNAVAWPTVLCGWLGLYLLGLGLLGVGLFFSAITGSQAVAALLTLVFALLMSVVNAGATGLEGTAREVFTFLSTATHLRRFALGVLDLSSVVYLLSYSVLGLFLAHRALEGRRWTG